MAETTPKTNTAEKQAPPAIIVRIPRGPQEVIEYRFRKTFYIGRDNSCEVQIPKEGISRVHAQVYYKERSWWLKDLNSANGTYVDGRRVKEIQLGSETTVLLGIGEVTLHFMMEIHKAKRRGTGKKSAKEKAMSLTHYMRHYFSDYANTRIGEHTRFIRQAFKQVQKKQRKRFLIAILILSIIAISFATFSYYQRLQIQKQMHLAENIFYSMKALELELNRLEELAAARGDTEAKQQVQQYRQQENEMAKNYNKLLDELNFYESSKWDEKDRVILSTARAFGECELAMPEEFLTEVKKYIKKWRTTPRLRIAIERAQQNDYARIVATTMLKYHLPPQFFYLALQESDFNIKTIGPRTRFGIAKGPWQFIPATASRYGLKTGPLVGLPKYDPKDERFHFQKATDAAARYIRDIYNTEAQASGLLVVASYNWGERKVRELVRKMPLNPRERNFWNLLTRYKKEIPRQTYDYVFYIFSAAVIGQNPALFGFDFENPLKATDDIM